MNGMHQDQSFALQIGTQRKRTEVPFLCRKQNRLHCDLAFAKKTLPKSPADPQFRE